MKQRPPNFRINRQAPLAKGLVFAGLGGGAGTLKIADASGYGNHGTLTNMDPLTDWAWDLELNRWVLDFDGSNDSLNLLRPIVFANGAPWSINFWYCLSSPVPNYAAVFTSRPLSGIYATWLILTGGRNYLYNDAQANSYVSTVTAAGLMHYAISHDGSKWSLYLGGAYKGQATQSGPYTVNKLGYDKTAQALFGTGGDFLIHNRVLSPSEIQALADPSNIDLRVGSSPLILPPVRRVFAVAPSGLSIPIAMRHYKQLMGAA